MSETETIEPGHHPYRRPKDAATLILVDRTGSIPKVLVGRRHDKVVFQPGKFVFPGGRVDKTDNRVAVAAPIPKALEENLLKGAPKITASRARALAIAAIREACEETGLCLGRKSNGKAPTLEGPWEPFTDAGLLPDPSGLFLIARAITPPGRVRRFDTRFFTADASTIAHRVEGVIHADANPAATAVAHEESGKPYLLLVTPAGRTRLPHALSISHSGLIAGAVVFTGPSPEQPRVEAVAVPPAVPSVRRHTGLLAVALAALSLICALAALLRSFR